MGRRTEPPRFCKPKPNRTATSAAHSSHPPCPRSTLSTPPPTKHPAGREAQASFHHVADPIKLLHDAHVLQRPVDAHGIRQSSCPAARGANTEVRRVDAWVEGVPSGEGCDSLEMWRFSTLIEKTRVVKTTTNSCKTPKPNRGNESNALNRS